MKNMQNEWWRWQLNRKIAEFLASPSENQHAHLNFMLSSYRSLHNTQQIELQKPGYNKLAK
jgi:hypothetical protein